MSSFGQDFLNGFAQGLQGPVLKDYQHAEDVFLPNYYANAPKQKFTFSVYFNVNTAIPGLATLFGSTGPGSLSLLVKNIQLPSFSVKLDEMNQYNRKRYVQTKIEYNPVQVTFHDDNDGLIRQMWYAYYSYYYGDPSYQYNNVPTGAPSTTSGGFNYIASDIYAQTRSANDFGYVDEGVTPYSGGTVADGQSTKPQFFNDITIYGFSQHNFEAYTLINPVIESFAHDTYDYAEGAAPMQNTMTVRYELVKYYTGAMNGANPNVPGFAQNGMYDFQPSSITRPGANQTILGQGGLLDAGAGVISDLESGNYLNAALTSLRTVNTFKNVNVKNLASLEINQRAKSIIGQSSQSVGQGIVPTINNNGITSSASFPTPPSGNKLNLPSPNSLVNGLI